MPGQLSAACGRLLKNMLSSHQLPGEQSGRVSRLKSRVSQRIALPAPRPFRRPSIRQFIYLTAAFLHCVPAWLWVTKAFIHACVVC